MKNESKIMKVTPVGKYPPSGYFMARSFEEFYLQLLRDDLNSFVRTLGDEKFTDLFFRTKSGNIYRIFKSEDLILGTSNWLLVNSRDSNFEYHFQSSEMYKGKIKLDESFFFGGYYLTTPVVEIICVNMQKFYPHIVKAPEAFLFHQFELLKQFN